MKRVSGKRSRRTVLSLRIVTAEHKTSDGLRALMHSRVKLKVYRLA